MTLSLVNIFYIICGFLLNFKVKIIVNIVISSCHQWLLVQIEEKVIISDPYVHFVTSIHRSSLGSSSVVALYQAPWKVF